MEHIDKDMDKGEIIQTFTNSGNYYDVKYLDGIESVYYSSNEDEVTKLRKLMIEQAKQRQELMSTKGINGLSKTYLFTALLSFSTAASLTFSRGISGAAWLLVLCGAISFYEFMKYHRIHKELKKYDKFLDIYKDIDTIKKFNNNIYTPELDIENLDEFSLSDVNYIYQRYLSSINKDNSSTLSK